MTVRAIQQSCIHGACRREEVSKWHYNFLAHLWNSEKNAVSSSSVTKNILAETSFDKEPTILFKNAFLS